MGSRKFGAFSSSAWGNEFYICIVPLVSNIFYGIGSADCVSRRREDLALHRLV